MGWYYVFCGGLLEIGFTTCMRYTDGFRNVPWTLGFLVCIAASMFCLEAATKTVPIGTAYAVWTGIGALGVATIGILFLGESASAPRLACMAMIAAGVVGLKFFSGE